MMTDQPARATAAPAYPPMRACDELVGRPKYHVMRSQAIAPVRPANTTAKVTTFTSIIPAPIVVATAVPNPNAATKLKNAAHATALPGESTRVDTTVAIELAASWKPLMKSKRSATATRTITERSVASSIALRVLDHDAFDHDRDLLAAVDRVLEEVEDLLPLDDRDGVGLLAEQARDGGAVHGVGLVLEPLRLDHRRERALAPLEPGQRNAQLVHRAPDQHRLLARLGADAVALVEREAVGGGGDRVRPGVERGGG